MALFYEHPVSNQQAQRSAKICVPVTVHIIFPFGYVPFQNPSNVEVVYGLKVPLSAIPSCGSPIPEEKDRRG